MQKLVSVIIPVYNRQEYITECVQSVLAQSYGEIEIIIVDDGSTDNTGEICAELAAKDNRIKNYVGTHKGVSAARNMAIEKATGDFIFFIDSDDIIHPRLIELLVNSMNKYGAQIGGTQCCVVNEKYWYQYKNKFLHHNTTDEYHVYLFEEALERTFAGTTPLSLIGGVMIQKDFVGETRFRTEFTIGEDFLFVYENLIKGTSVVFLEDRLYMNRIHQNNSSWDYSYKGFISRFKRREFVWQQEEKFGRHKNANQQKYEVYGIYLNCLRHNRGYSKDCRLMRKTIRKNQKVLLRGLGLKRKILFLAIMYLPFMGVAINKYKKK